MVLNVQSGGGKVPNSTGLENFWGKSLAIHFFLLHALGGKSLAIRFFLHGILLGILLGLEPKFSILLGILLGFEPNTVSYSVSYSVCRKNRKKAEIPDRVS